MQPLRPHTQAGVRRARHPDVTDLRGEAVGAAANLAVDGQPPPTPVPSVAKRAKLG